MYSGSGSFPAEEMKYLKLLSNQYKNINSAATEIIMYSETHPALSRTRLVQSLGRACAAVRKNHWQH